MTARWLILADDLTGAADAAVAFARRGFDTAVRWGEPSSGDVAVQALDLGSRTVGAAEAAARHGDAVRRWHPPGQSLFKKIDSTLRGQPAAEMAALSAALRAQGRPSWGLLAPANPAMRRTTRDGRVFVDAVPLEDTGIWQREHTYPSADLAAVVRSAGLHAIRLPLATVRADDAAVRDAVAAAERANRETGTVLVADAATDADLGRLVAAARDCAPGFWIGTAGLAQALAAAAPARPAAPLALDATSRGTLVAVGTLAPVSRQAAQRLAVRDGRDLVRIGLDDVADAAVAAAVGERLGRGETVVALLDGPEVSGRPIDPRYARRFAEALAPALERIGALVVTGGDTAAAVLGRARVHGIRLLDEVEPGIALGLTQGAIEVPVVTKPGAFGDPDSLVRCLDTLSRLRRTR
ncbi:MAG: four-carbon acid sugar kinase family protein [Vicinamibacterales bacterium]